MTIIEQMAAAVCKVYFTNYRAFLYSMVTMYITRLLEDQIEQSLSNDKIIILLGARQVGKTTLIEPFVQRAGGQLLNCDIEVDRTRLLAASALPPEAAMQALDARKLLVIDEAQNLSDIGRIVKGWYDAKVPIKIVLLGSSSLDLLDQAAEPLTGRNQKLYLTPLLFDEVIRSQPWYSAHYAPESIQQQFAPQVQALLIQQMVYGGYPEVYTSSDKDRYLLNLTSDYLLRDVLYGGLVKSPGPIKRLLSALAHQAGGEVVVSRLSADLGIARATIENYLEILERSYVIFRLNAFHTNQRKEIGKNMKVFFWDTGVRNALLKEFSMSPQRSDIGSLFKNWAVAEIAKRNVLEGGLNNLYFWRNSDGGEVDLVVKGSEGLAAYEFKWSKSSLRAGAHSFTSLYGVSPQTITRDRVMQLVS